MASTRRVYSAVVHARGGTAETLMYSQAGGGKGVRSSGRSYARTRFGMYPRPVLVAHFTHPPVMDAAPLAPVPALLVFALLVWCTTLVLVGVTWAAVFRFVLLRIKLFRELLHPWTPAPSPPPTTPQQ
ncbi:hypothetical protein EON66_04610 [archaeon]|nr:MAG: hypothetical protein EON66_04610 [archaeon]